MISYTSNRPCVGIYINDERTSTRNKFTSYLGCELNREGEKLLQQRGVEIKYFTEDTVRKGIPLQDEIKKTIESVLIALVIISNSYATEDCLNQLLHILEQKKQKGDNYMVLPVFYLVNPTEVADQTEKFAKVFANLGKTFGPQKCNEWKKALADVTAIGGRVVLPDKSEVDFVSLITSDVVKHVNWLCDQGIIAVTSAGNPSGIETSIENSQKPVLNYFTVPPEALGCEASAEWILLEEHRNQGKCSVTEVYDYPCPRPAPKMVISGHLTNCKSDESTEQRPSKGVIVEALKNVVAFFSKDFEADSQNMEDLSGSFRILRSLTKEDGINIVEKRRLSILENEFAFVVARIRSCAEGKKEVNLAIQCLDQQLDRFRELSAERETVESNLREVGGKLERLKAEKNDVKRSKEVHSKLHCSLNNLLKSESAQLEKLKNANLGEQKVQVEELEKSALQRRKKIQHDIRGLITKVMEF